MRELQEINHGCLPFLVKEIPDRFRTDHWQRGREPCRNNRIL